MFESHSGVLSMKKLYTSSSFEIERFGFSNPFGLMVTPENGSSLQMSCGISPTTYDATKPPNSTPFQHPISIPVYTLIALYYILW
jgi:hypothetical protein